MMTKKIDITIKLFSDLREYGPATSTIRIPEKSDIKYLLDKYRIPKEKKNLMILVNGLPHHKVDYVLNKGDIVAIFPPTAGG
jgi:molybdopterin converting factor small subunit